MKQITENSQYIRFDWAIKRILRDKTNKKVLEGLISVLIKEPVIITEILESENNKIRKEDKDNRVDVKAKTADGEYIIVEVQLTKETDFFQRILFGTTSSINDQIGTGMDYNTIKKVYSINILYFNFGTGEDYAYHGYMEFHGMTKKDSILTFNTENEQKYVNRKITEITPPEKVFPEYFLLRVNQFNEVAKTPIEEWMAYLKDGIIKDDTTDPGLQEARNKLNIMRMTVEEQRAYRDYMVSVHAAKDAFETAKTDGRLEGIAEGYAEGKAEGKAEGLAEGEKKKSIESARKMKADKMPTELISKYTGLSIEEVGEL